MSLDRRLERALADLVAGYDGGLSMWEAALCGLELAVREARAAGSTAFHANPRSQLRKLLLAVDDALRRAQFAVELRTAIMEDGDRVGADDYRDRIEELLLEHVRRLVDERSS